jgi:putative aldouronate transport system substrate-binding protein
MKRRILAVLLVFLAGNLAFAGAAKQTEGPSGGTTSSAGSYPIKTNAILSYWLTLDLNVSPNYANLGETPFAKGLEERTGVKINYLHPPTGTTAAREQLNLMIADGSNMPDMVEWNWLTEYPGGPQKAIDDGVILKLNEIIDRYCPNFKAFLKAHPDYDRMIKTDDGSYYAFPLIRDGETTLYTQGLMIRKDWLDELGLPPPTTIDEWHTVLIAFKEKKNTPSPFTMVFTNNQRMLVESFGILKGFYVGATDGKIHFGQIEPGYRDWMNTMAQWYREGLIDPDIASIQTSQQNQKMTSGEAGATVASVGSGIGTWTNSVRPTNPKFEIMALPGPERVKGQKKIYGIPNSIYAGTSVAISASSKNVEIAARFLDYGYSEAGHLYYCFGTEGESYAMINGRPVYTDLVMNSPKGWSIGQALSAYNRGVSGGGAIALDNGINPQYYTLPEQKAALTAYNTPGASQYLLPPITPTQEESRELASIMNDINTYSDEMMTKFILGTETLNDASWNNFVNTVRRMGIDRAVAIQNTALDRYKKR